MQKRMVAVFAAVAVLFTGLFARLFLLSDGALKAASYQQSTRTQTLGVSRGTIYDRYLRPLVNRQTVWVSSVSPYADMSELLPLLNDERTVVLREAFANGYRATVCSEEPMPEYPFLVQAEMPLRYGESPIAAHVIGYVDGENKGVAGIEKGYDERLLSYRGEWRIAYAIDALGRAAGESVEYSRNTFDLSKGGVALTLDRDIQKICEEAALLLPAGAILVSDAASGQVLADVSTPSFDPNDVQAFLEREDAPLMDRTLCNYNVGSVFKIVVAAAALEAGIGPDTAFSCDGKTDVNGVVFACRDHGFEAPLTMAQAMAYSCNTYFIRLAQEVGAKAVVDMARRAQFSSALSPAKGVSTDEAVFPDQSELIALAALANIAIGQGPMLSSVYHVHALLSAVANNGVWREPMLYAGDVDAEGHLTPPSYKPQERVLFSAKTAAQIQSMLCAVTAYGTGGQARASVGEAAGKTGTAQTGWIQNGEEVVQSWFSGYYPAHNPQYVITVLSENGGANGHSASPFFASVCNGLFRAGLVEISQDLY